MKAFTLMVCYIIFTVVLLRFAVPSLLNARDNVSVILGIIAVVIWFILTAAGVMGKLQPAKPQPKRRRKSTK